MFSCLHCGSRNHRSDDCPTPERTFVHASSEPPQEPAPQESQPEATSAEPALWPARWPGGPPICSKENLPAFKDRKEAMAYSERWCGPDGPKELADQCGACKMFHFKARKSKRPQYPAGFKPRLPKRAGAPERVAEPELPRREVAAKPVVAARSDAGPAKRQTPGQASMF